jgi:hypothetical protein
VSPAGRTLGAVGDLAGVIEQSLSSYRALDRGPAPRLDVDRWVRQFHPFEQEPLLRTVAAAVERSFWSFDRVVAALESFADGLGPALERSAIVPTQGPRTGQATLDRLWGHVLVGRGIRQCRPADALVRVYLDDALCTGRTMERGLRRFLTAGPPVRVPVIAWHVFDFAWDPAGRRSALGDGGVRFTSAATYENRPSALGGLDVVWPLPGLPLDGYGRRVGRGAFRPRDLFGDGALFLEEGDREIVEGALVRVGVRLAAAAGRPALRPLGAGEGPTLGFGCMAATFHGAPATMPLALWSDADGWFPLLPRR